MTGAECLGLVNFLQSLKFLPTALTFKIVFDFIKSISRVLQTHDIIDISMAIDMFKILIVCDI